MIILASMLGRSLVSVNFPVPMTKYLAPPQKKSALVWKRLFWTQFGVIVHHKKARQQERQAFGDTAPIIRRWRTWVLSPLSPFYSVQDASLRNGVAHTQRGSSSLSEISLETPSQTRPGVCPRSFQTSRADGDK